MSQDNNNTYLAVNQDVRQTLGELARNYHDTLGRFGGLYDSMCSNLNSGAEAIIKSQEALGRVRTLPGGKVVATVRQLVKKEVPNPNYSPVSSGINRLLGRSYDTPRVIEVEREEEREVELGGLVLEIKRDYAASKNNIDAHVQAAESEIETAGSKIGQLYDLQERILEDKERYKSELVAAEEAVGKTKEAVSDYEASHQHEKGTIDYERGLLQLKQDRREAIAERGRIKGLAEACDVSLIQVHNLREAYEVMVDEGLVHLVGEGYKGQKSMEQALGQLQVTTSAQITAAGLAQVIGEAAKRHVTTSRDLSGLMVMISGMVHQASEVSGAFYQPLIDSKAIEASRQILLAAQENQRRLSASVEQIEHLQLPSPQ